MKIIVAHISPDLDALSSIWLIKKFLKGWGNANVEFVPAGSTLNNKNPDENPNIIHVDTGFGMFDHHQTSDFTCAAKKVFLFIKENENLKKNFSEALERMTDVIVDFDHFQEVYLDSPDKDIYDFMVVSILEGISNKYHDNELILDISEKILDGILQTFLNKIAAEKEIKEGLIFKSKWGRSLAIESDNEEVVRLAQKKDFSLVIRKNKKNGYVRIKTMPSKKLNLKELYEEIIKKDKKGYWFFHKSGNMLLNGSSKNPNTTPTNLSLNEVVKITKNIV